MKQFLFNKLIYLYRNPILVPILFPIILFLPVIVKGEVFYWGTMSLQFVPWHHLAWEIFSSGEIPLWNPYVGMGAPFLANYQLGFFYPLNWILYIFHMFGGAAWLAWGLTLLVIIHLVLAGAGMAALSKKFGLSNIAQIISGVSFGFSGYLLNRISFLSINATVVWMPWIILFCIPDTNHKGQRIYSIKQQISLIFVLCMMLLGGHAQTSWYIIMFAIMFLAFLRVIFNIDNSCWFSFSGKNILFFPKFNRKLMGQLLIITFMSLLITSIQLLPTLEYLTYSQRASQVDFQTAITYSYWPWRIITLIAPDIFGSPVNGDYWGYGNYWEDSLYFGVLPLIAVISLLFGKNKKSKRQIESNDKYKSITCFLFMVCLISFLLAFGKNTPIFPFLYENIITFDMFQAPTRYSLWAQFSLALLAGIGFDTWKKPTKESVYWLRLGIAGAFAVAIGAGFTQLLFGDVINSTFIRATSRLGFYLVGVGLLLYFFPYGRDTNKSSERVENPINQIIWETCVVLFLMMDLFSASWGHNPSTHRAIYQQRQIFSQIGGILKDGRIFLPEKYEYDLKFKIFMRFDTYRGVDEWTKLRDFLLPNIHLLDQIRSVNNFDPIISSRYARWIEILNELYIRGDVEPLRYLLNLSDVHVVEFINPNFEENPHFKLIEGSKRFHWYNCVQSIESDTEVLEKLLTNFNHNNEILYITQPIEKNDVSCPQDEVDNYLFDENVKILNEKANSIQLSVVAPSDGYFMISDSWFPGWHVWVDGNRSNLYRANYMFRAVYLEEGQHNVDFVYKPLSFYIGTFLSLVGIMFFMLLIIKKRLRDDSNQ